MNLKNVLKTKSRKLNELKCKMAHEENETANLKFENVQEEAGTKTSRKQLKHQKLIMKKKFQKKILGKKWSYDESKWKKRNIFCQQPPLFFFGNDANAKTLNFFFFLIILKQQQQLITESNRKRINYTNSRMKLINQSGKLQQIKLMIRQFNFAERGANRKILANERGRTLDIFINNFTRPISHDYYQLHFMYKICNQTEYIHRAVRFTYTIQDRIIQRLLNGPDPMSNTKIIRNINKFVFDEPNSASSNITNFIIQEGIVLNNKLGILKNQIHPNHHLLVNINNIVSFDKADETLKSIKSGEYESNPTHPKFPPFENTTVQYKLLFDFIEKVSQLNAIFREGHTRLFEFEPFILNYDIPLPILDTVAEPRVWIFFEEECSMQDADPHLQYSTMFMLHITNNIGEFYFANKEMFTDVYTALAPTIRFTTINQETDGKRYKEFNIYQLNDYINQFTAMMNIEEDLFFNEIGGGTRLFILLRRFLYLTNLKPYFRFIYVTREQITKINILPPNGKLILNIEYEENNQDNKVYIDITITNNETLKKILIGWMKFQIFNILVLFEHSYDVASNTYATYSIINIQLKFAKLDRLNEAVVFNEYKQLLFARPVLCTNFYWPTNIKSFLYSLLPSFSKPHFNCLHELAICFYSIVWLSVSVKKTPEKQNPDMSLNYTELQEAINNYNCGKHNNLKILMNMADKGDKCDINAFVLQMQKQYESFEGKKFHFLIFRDNFTVQDYLLEQTNLNDPNALVLVFALHSKNSEQINHVGLGVRWKIDKYYESFPNNIKLNNITSIKNIEKSFTKNFILKSRTEDDPVHRSKLIHIYIDIETGTKGKRMAYLLCSVLEYEKKEIEIKKFWGSDCIQQFMAYLQTEIFDFFDKYGILCNDKGFFPDVHIWTFNGSRFDLIYFLPYIPADFFNIMGTIHDINQIIFNITNKDKDRFYVIKT